MVFGDDAKRVHAVDDNISMMEEEPSSHLRLNGPIDEQKHDDHRRLFLGRLRDFLRGRGFKLPNLSISNLLPGRRGARDGPFDLDGLVPAASASLPDGKDLLWSAYSKIRSACAEDPGGQTYVGIFDPITL